MESKFGKREKIVVGSIIGILAIAGIHFFLFADRAQQTTALKAEIKALADENAKLPDVRDPKMLETYQAKTVEDQKALWEAALKMDLLMEPYVMGDPEPKKPNEDDKDASKKLADYNKKMAAYEKTNRPKQIAADTVLLDQFRRLFEMKQAYEAGEKYKTDLPPRLSRSGHFDSQIEVPRRRQCGMELPACIEQTYSEQG